MNEGDSLGDFVVVVAIGSKQQVKNRSAQNKLAVAVCGWGLNVSRSIAELSLLCCALACVGVESKVCLGLRMSLYWCVFPRVYMPMEVCLSVFQSLCLKPPT